VKRFLVSFVAAVVFFDICVRRSPTGLLGDEDATFAALLGSFIIGCAVSLIYGYLRSKFKRRTQTGNEND